MSITKPSSLTETKVLQNYNWHVLKREKNPDPKKTTPIAPQNWSMNSSHSPTFHCLLSCVEADFPGNKLDQKMDPG